jgi:hypothetical protein
LAAAIRLYLDENLSPVIAEQLRLRGIDAVSVRDLGTLGESDEFHFKRANELVGQSLRTSANKPKRGSIRSTSKPVWTGPWDGGRKSHYAG